MVELGFSGGPADDTLAPPAREAAAAWREWQHCASLNDPDVGQVLASSGYDFDSFAVEVTLPACIVIRQAHLMHYLRATLPRDVRDIVAPPECDTVTDVKEALKPFLYGAVRAAGGKHSQAGASLERDQHASHPSPVMDPEADMRIAFCFLHHCNGPEARGLVPLPTAKLGRKRYRGGRRRVAVDPTAPTPHTGGYDAAAKALALLSPADLAARFARGPPSAAATPPAASSTGEAEPCTVDGALRPCVAAVKCGRRPVWVGGRYLKLLRGLPQSPWIVEEAEKGPGSLQEVLAASLLPLLGSQDATFITAGREDIDVRMLGSGRPFAFEVTNARRIPTQPELSAAAAALDAPDAPARALHCRMVPKTQLTLLKEGEAEKQKTYEAVCWIDRPATAEDLTLLNGIQDCTIQQATPLRVLHRRSALTRPRTIYSMEARAIEGNPQYFVLRMKTQAGVYVKEFVHGDMGRTSPNVGELLECEAQILQLDVVDVHLDF